MATVEILEVYPKLLRRGVDELEAARSQLLEDLVGVVFLSNLPQFWQGFALGVFLEDILRLRWCSIVQVDKVIVKTRLLGSAVEFIDHILEELEDELVVLGILPVATV